MKGMLSLIATVIAIITYKTATNPPSEVYSLEKITKMCTPINKYDKICSGEEVMSVVQPELYSQFLNTTTTCFFASLTVCLILVSGIRLEHRLFMWLLSLGMLTILSTFAHL